MAAHGPWLISQAYSPSTTDQLISFTITGLPGGTVTPLATFLPDGTGILQYDLSGVTPGTYAITVTANNTFGSSIAASFSLTVVAKPVPAQPVLSTTTLQITNTRDLAKGSPR